MVSGNYYSVLGVEPQLGRGIQESDDGSDRKRPGGDDQRQILDERFERSPDVIGEVIQVNATPMTIVGVNPRGFTGAYSAQGTPDVFLPFSMQPVVAPQDLEPSQSPSLQRNKNLWWVLVMGRAKQGVPAAQPRHRSMWR